MARSIKETKTPIGELLIGEATSVQVSVYSTVTVFARLRGLSTSRPRALATW